VARRLELPEGERGVGEQRIAETYPIRIVHRSSVRPRPWCLAILPQLAIAPREKERRLLEVPAEVDLGTGDLVLVVKGENLGIPSPSTAGGVGLIGNDHLVARLDQPDELEVLAAAGAGPATLEVAVTVELWVRWRREEKVIAQALLEEAPVAGCKRGI
jgi:hypothetical protein